MFRAVLLSLCLAAAPARAVIISGGDGTGNDTATGAGGGWNYVGNLNGASGVYLGDYGGSYWVLTASHVGANVFTLNGVTYYPINGSAEAITNPDGTTADLTLFRIDGNPGLAQLTLATRAPRTFASVTMIGNGVGREATETSGLGGLYNGYRWQDPHKIRWGQNTVLGTATPSYEVNSTMVYTTSFYTQFTQFSGSAQATVGDSGGGVFTSSGALAGIMIATTSQPGQPADTSVYGDTTYAADIATYRTQILGIISATPVPEPAIGLLLLLGLAPVALRIRRAGLR